MVLYIARLGGGAGPSLHCTPCHHCLACIKDVGIEKIVFVDENGEVQAARTKWLEASHVSLGNRLLGKRS